MRQLTVVGATVACTFVWMNPGASFAQTDYPNRPIRWVTPYPPGGSTTKLSRLVGDYMGEAWGQNVIIDNRPGGDTIIGTELVARSAPDGYTVLLAGNSSVLTALTHKTPYDIFKDFTPVSIIARTNYILVVNPNLPAKTLKEFIAYAKARPGKLNVASVSSGSSQHLMGELFGQLAGVRMTHIPYKGGAAGIIDLMGGRVEASFSNAINVIPFIQAGKLRGLAITGDTRVDTAPDVPTYAEAGLPQYKPKNWQGMIAPAGVPVDIVRKLAAEIRKIVSIPNVKKILANSGMDPNPTSPEEMAQEMRSGRDEYIRILKAANLKLIE